MDDKIEVMGSFADGRISINLSDIYTKLIQEAGRLCDHYASDLLISIDTVKKFVNNPDKWDKYENNVEYFKNDKGTEQISFLFGFRESGVDHREYVESIEEQYGEHWGMYYRALWELTITKKIDGYCFVHATLKRIYP